MLKEFVIGLFALAFFAIMYIALNEAHTQVYAFGQSQITSASGIVTMGIINTAWIWLPLVILISFLVYIISSGVRKSEASWP